MRGHFWEATFGAYDEHLSVLAVTEMGYGIGYGSDEQRSRHVLLPIWHVRVVDLQNEVEILRTV